MLPIRVSIRLSRWPSELLEFPRHLSQHVGGFVISETHLDEIVPIENAAMEERTVIEWDKDDLDVLEILKVDVLGLGMLSCLRRGLDLIEKHYGIKHTLASIPEDEPRFTTCCRAPTPLVSSRWKAARRCRCCRGLGRKNSTIW